MQDAPLAVAAPQKIAEVWELCPFVDQVVPLPNPRSLLSTSKILREGKFKTAILLPNSLRTAAEATVGAVAQIIGYPGHLRRLLLTDIVEQGSFDIHRRHHQYFYIDLMTALGAPDTASFPALKQSSSISTANQICICPGAEYGPAKRWPESSFAQVARELRSSFQSKLILLGAAKDVEVAGKIAAEFPEIENRTGKTTLSELISTLRESRLVISNDSGSMHLASALGVPTVAIFGSTEPRRTGPLGPKTRVLRHHVPCSPCYLRECPLDFSCMKSISPEMVLAACRELLQA